MPGHEFTLLGDAVWLDFVNTRRGRLPTPPDLLPDIAAYGRWAATEQLDTAAERFPFAEVLLFRDRLTELAEALHRGRQPPPGAIAALNARLARSSGHQQLSRVEGVWRLRFAATGAHSALDAIARSAAATLTDPNVAVRCCAADDCSLFFLESAPNPRRHWCDPEGCGRPGRVERRRRAGHPRPLD